VPDKRADRDECVLSRGQPNSYGCRAHEELAVAVWISKRGNGEEPGTLSLVLCREGAGELFQTCCCVHKSRVRPRDFIWNVEEKQVKDDKRFSSTIPYENYLIP
jgi:hypothetical protein